MPLPPARGATEPTKCPLCADKYYTSGAMLDTWRGTRGTLPPRQTTRRRPPTSSRGGHGGPHGMPCTPGTPRARRPATRRARWRRPERPRGLAVQPNKDPSPRGWPTWPPCGPRWKRAPHTPWLQHTQETWLLQWTERHCRCRTADSKKTRRTSPYGSSHGNCATVSSHQTGPSGTRPGGARGRRPVPTRSTLSPACYPGREALPLCSRKQGSPPGRRGCTWPWRSGERSTPPSSAAGWQRQGPLPPREGEASSPRSAASM